MRDIEYFYSAHSVFAYIGSARLMEIAAAAGRRLVHRPVFLDAVVAAAYPGGFSGRSRAHRDYYFGREIERWAEFRNVAIKVGIPRCHFNDMTLANSMVIAAAMEGGNADQLAHSLLEAHWRDHADLADEATLAGVAGKAGLNSETLFGVARGPEAKAAYEANTAEAIERLVFGSPAYFVDGDMFYGQDRLELVGRALQKPFARTWPSLADRR